MASGKPIITMTDITKVYSVGGEEVRALDGANLTIREGEFVSIIGPSGSGKSTLLAILSGLMLPDTGGVSSLGVPLSKVSSAERVEHRRAHSGFVFQGFNLFPALTALEQVLLPLHYMGMRGGRAEDHARAMLSEVGLDHRLHYRPAQLSGGEQQRVAIARALAKRPKLLFADEPTSALDSQSGSAVITLLQAVARQQGTTVVCVSHDPRLIDHADHVFRMEDGQVSRSDSGHAVYA